VEQTSAQRYLIESPSTKMLKRLMIPFTVLFIAWIPLTWFYGTVTTKDVATAVLFSGTFAAFLVLAWIPALRRGLRDSRDPGRNYVAIEDDRVDIVIDGRKRHYRFSQIASVERGGDRRVMDNRVSERVVINLRISFLRTMVDGLDRRGYKLRIADADAFARALSAHLT
jgi:hypothetical protein